MSVVVSGPRRLYVILFFWQRLTDSCSACPRSLSRAASALGATAVPVTAQACDPVCRLVLRFELQRVLWHRLIGFSVLVLDPQGTEAARERGTGSR